MESDSNPAVSHSASEMQDSMDNGNGYSKDPEASDGNEWKEFRDEYNPSSPNGFKSSENSSPKLETHSNEPDSLVISTLDESSSEYLEKLSTVVKHLKETSFEKDKISTKNGTASTVRISNMSPSNEDGSTQAAFSEETESPEVNKPSSDETEVENIPVCEKIASTTVNQSLVSGSTEGNQMALSEETEAKLKPVSEEAPSATVGQKSFSEKPESVKTTKLAHAENGESTDMKTPVSYGKINAKMAITPTPLVSQCDNKTPVSSNDSEEISIYSSLKEFYEKKIELDRIAASIEMKLPNAEKNSPKSLPRLLDTRKFFSLLDTEEYKNAYVLSMPTGNVIVTPTEGYEKMFQAFDTSSCLPKSTTYNPPAMSNKPFTTIDESVLNEDTCSKIPLATLISTFSSWVNRNLRRCSKIDQNPNLEHFVELTRKELKFALDLLRAMNKRIDALLKAVYGLPDPASILPRELQSGKISIREILKDAGLKVQRKIQQLETEGFEFYNVFVLLFTTDENSRTENVDPKLLVITANAKFHNLVAKTGGDFLKLISEIEHFRDNIRDFCLEIDRFL